MLAAGGTAQAVAPTGTFGFKVSPTKASKSSSDLRGLEKLTLSGTIDPLPGAIQPPVTDTLTIEFKDQFVVNRKAVKGTAKKTDVERVGDCSSKYRLATGNVTAHANPLIPTIVTDLNVCIVKRKPGDTLTLALGAKYAPLGIVLVVDGHIKVKKKKPQLIIDAKLPSIAGITPVISKISARTKDLSRHVKVKVKGKKKKVRKKIHLLSNPVKCPKRGEHKKTWRATQVTTFQGGVEQLAASATTKCRPR